MKTTESELKRISNALRIAHKIKAMLELESYKKTLILHARICYSNEKYSFEQFVKEIQNCKSFEELDKVYYKFQTDDDVRYDII